jgi:hypothetical protein
MARKPTDGETPSATAGTSAKSSKAAKDKPPTKARPKPVLTVVEGTPEPKVGTLKLKELLDQVATSTGSRKPDVKATVEATLSALGEALATGRSLAVPPLGKLRVVKNKGPALTLKLRLADGPKAAGLALADDGEDG